MKIGMGTLFLAGGVLAGVGVLLLTSKSEAQSDPSQPPSEGEADPVLNATQRAAKPGDLVLVDTSKLMAARVPSGTTSPPLPPGFPPMLITRIDSADAVNFTGHTEDKSLGINPLTQAPLLIPMLNVPRSVIEGIVG